MTNTNIKYELDFSDFYDISLYGNNNWKGSFTQKEIANNAYDYLCEYKESIKNKQMTRTIQELLKLLKEDNNDETEYWIECLSKIPNRNEA